MRGFTRATHTEALLLAFQIVTSSTMSEDEGAVGGKPDIKRKNS